MKHAWKIVWLLVIFISTTYTSLCLMEWHYLTILLTAPLSVMAMLNSIGDE